MINGDHRASLMTMNDHRAFKKSIDYDRCPQMITDDHHNVAFDHFLCYDDALKPETFVLFGIKKLLSRKALSLLHFQSRKIKQKNCILENIRQKIP